MKKELVFLLIGEKREPHNFIRKVGTLIQVPITRKDTHLTVFEKLSNGAGDMDQLQALSIYGAGFSKKDEDLNFMEFHGFTPEPDIALFAIFELKELKT